jgi:hypothetical protein
MATDRHRFKALTEGSDEWFRASDGLLDGRQR